MKVYGSFVPSSTIPADGDTSLSGSQVQIGFGELYPKAGCSHRSPSATA